MDWSVPTECEVFRNGKAASVTTEAADLFRKNVLTYGFRHEHGPAIVEAAIRACTMQKLRCAAICAFAKGRLSSFVVRTALVAAGT